MAAYRWDQSELPLVRYHWTEPLTADEDRAVMERIATLFARQQHHAVILRTTSNAQNSKRSRRRWREFIVRHRQDYATYCVGVAAVDPTGVARMFYSALNVFTKLPHPVHYVATEEAAEIWCRNMLRKRGVTKPSAQAW